MERVDVLKKGTDADNCEWKLLLNWIYLCIFSFYLNQNLIITLYSLTFKKQVENSVRFCSFNGL